MILLIFILLACGATMAGGVVVLLYGREVCRNRGVFGLVLIAASYIAMVIMLIAVQYDSPEQTSKRRFLSEMSERYDTQVVGQHFLGDRPEHTSYIDSTHGSDEAGHPTITFFWTTYGKEKSGRQKEIPSIDDI